MDAPSVQPSSSAPVLMPALVPAPFGARLGVVQPSFDVALSGADWSQLAAELRLHCGVATHCSILA